MVLRLRSVNSQGAQGRISGGIQGSENGFTGVKRSNLGITWDLFFALFLITGPQLVLGWKVGGGWWCPQLFLDLKEDPQLFLGRKEGIHSCSQTEKGVHSFS